MAISLRPDSSDVTSVRLAFISHASEWRLSDVYRQTLYLSDNHFRQLALHDILQRATKVLHRYLVDYVEAASDSALHTYKGLKDAYTPSEQIGNNAVKIRMEPVVAGVAFGTAVKRKTADSVSVSHAGSNSVKRRITDPVTVSIPSRNSISKLRSDYSLVADTDSVWTVKGVSDSTSAGAAVGTAVTRKTSDSVSASHTGSNSANKRAIDSVSASHAGSNSISRLRSDYSVVADTDSVKTVKGVSDSTITSTAVSTAVTRKPTDTVSALHTGSNSISRLRSDYSLVADADSVRTVKGVSDRTSAGAAFGGSFYKSLYDAYGYDDSSLVTAYKVTTDFAIPLEYITSKAFVKVLRDSVVLSEMFLTDASYNSNWRESASVAGKLGMVTARKVADSAVPSDTQSFVIAIGSASVIGSASIGDFALGA